MRTFLLLFLAFVVSTCFGQRELRLLKSAYKLDSQSMLDSFFQQWQRVSTPVKSLDSLSDLQKDVYQIYLDYYNPFNLKRVGEAEMDDSSYAGIDYVIIQNSIPTTTYKADTLDASVFKNKDSLKLSSEKIKNFRPDIQFEQAKTLYLFPKYEKVINKFLGSKSYPLGFGGIMSPSSARGESADRLKFLNKRVGILHGHWGGYWHIETHPYIYGIDFNQNRTEAIVHFRLGYEGGVAFYKKNNGKWELIVSRIKWIE